MKTNNVQRQLATQLLDASQQSVEIATQALREVAAGQPQVVAAPYVPKNSEVIARAVNVSKKYKVGRTQVQALHDVSLDIYKGEFVALTGTSGSGKSTLLQLLGGLDKPNQGAVEIGGQNLAKLRDGKLSTFRNQTIGFVFQFFYLQPFLKLQTNVEVPGMFANTKRQVRAGRSSALAEQVGLSERLRHLPRELSGGQMQRAAIARALLNQPPILLADEPTGNLDSANAQAIFKLFRTICDEQGTTIVVVTHDRELAGLADRSVVLSDGRIV